MTFPVTKDYLKTLICEKFITDERYRKGHVNILATAPGTEVLGIHTPEMKSVAREIVKSGRWREQIGLWKAHSPLSGEGGLSHEERVIWGFVIDYAKCSLDERLTLLDEFLPAIDNWAICDMFCAASKWARKEDTDRLWDYLHNLLQSREEFKVRVALIMAMCHFIGPEDIDRTFRCLEERKFTEGEAYYIRMGAAWLLATCLAKQPDRTRAWLKTSSLPDDILKLYVRKARESRITKDCPPF